MIKIKSIAALRKETLETISKQDIKEIGTLLLNTVQELENVHTEIGIDQTKAADDGLIDFEYKLEDQSTDLKSQYETLLQEYQKRFSGEYSNNNNNNNNNNKDVQSRGGDNHLGQNEPENKPAPIDIFEQEGE